MFKMKPSNLISPFGWVGGKNRLALKLLDLAPQEIGTYYEPFVGGGSLLFMLEHEDVVINDINPNLVAFYEMLNSPDNIWEEFKAKVHEHEQLDSVEHFNYVRALDRVNTEFTLVERAARFIYLLKRAFSNLWRTNKLGQNNAPINNSSIGKPVYDREWEQLRLYFRQSNITIYNGDFQQVVVNAIEGDFVYFDPPYDNLTENESFTRYSENDFGKDEQVKLFLTCKSLHERGVKFIVSNYNTPFIRELYKEFNIEIVKIALSIKALSPHATSEEVEEVIIKNY